jgi:prepilin-type N-terminal cleavage/methylation domain-containing protein
MRHQKEQAGLTLIELMIALAVAAVLILIGLPDFDAIGDKRSLRGAVDAMQRDIRFARTESLKRNQEITLAFDRNSSTDWCYGLSVGAAACDCDGGGDCTIDTVPRLRTSDEMRGVELDSAPANVTFDPNFGTAGAGTTVELLSENGIEANLIVSPLGRVLVCSPESNKYGFQACP